MSSSDRSIRVPVPLSVKREALWALEMRRRYGRGGTNVGLRTARRLSTEREVPLRFVRKIALYFPRHAVDARAQGWRVAERGYPSAGRIAWALWGGSPARRWAERVVRGSASPLVRQSAGPLVR